jgi:hypothetical protein
MNSHGDLQNSHFVTGGYGFRTTGASMLTDAGYRVVNVNTRVSVSHFTSGVKSSASINIGK